MRKEKVTTLSEAAKLIKSGDTVILGGALISMHPMALIRQMIRDGIKDLTVVGFDNGNDVDLLAAAGCLKRVEQPLLHLKCSAWPQVIGLPLITTHSLNRSIPSEKFSLLTLTFKSPLTFP